MSSKGLPVDLELKKAFQELQVKMVTTSQELEESDRQAERFRQQISHSKNVCKELESLPADTQTYKSIGRMFMKAPMTEIMDELKESSEKSVEKIKNIESTKTYLERTLKDHESNLRELVMSKQKGQGR